MTEITFAKIDRFAAWLLLFLIIIFIISGYGLTKGIISPQLAKFLHSGYLPILLIAAFAVHTFYAIRLAFIRWKMWNIVSKYLLIAVYALFFAYFSYIGLIYNKPTPAAIDSKSQVAAVDPSAGEITSQEPSAPSANNQESVQQKTTPLPSQEKYFTVQKLAAYNGLNGQPAYVAINGLVYDLSSVFINGQHAGYSAGQDLTATFNSQHPKSLLARYPIVGKLK